MKRHRKRRVPIDYLFDAKEVVCFAPKPPVSIQQGLYDFEAVFIRHYPIKVNNKNILLEEGVTPVNMHIYIKPTHVKIKKYWNIERIKKIFSLLKI